MNRLRTWHWLILWFISVLCVGVICYLSGRSNAQARWNDRYLNTLQAERVQSNASLTQFHVAIDRLNRIMLGPSRKMLASWYGEPFHGRTAADGSTYDMFELTCASLDFPFGARLIVQSLDRPGLMVAVTNTDRGPFIFPRTLDLSYAAALALGMVEDGVAVCRVTPIDRPIISAAKKD